LTKRKFVGILESCRGKCCLTIDGNLEYQQNLSAINFAIIVLGAPDNTFDTLRPLMAKVIDALNTIKVGELVHIDV
jgi:hypothetical protein